MPPPQACQAAIDLIEKRNETFKAAVQGSEGAAQGQEVNEDSVVLPGAASLTGLIPLCSTPPSQRAGGHPQE